MLLYDFKPTLNEETVQNYIQQYQQEQNQFAPEDLKLIQAHADYYKLPFAYNQKDHEESIGGAIKQLGSGFLSGFTTINVGDDPKGTYEGIARSVGHLAGFAGIIPIPGKLARVSKLAAALKSFQGKSVPMLAANLVEKKVAPIASNVMNRAIGGSHAARGAAASFLESGKTQDIIRGAFHLGVASSVSSWQGGVDEMMKAFMHGGVTGGVFRTIGNVVKTGNEIADKTLRTLSSSLYTGLPSTLRDATAPEQVYEYLLGAYFGYKEMPYHRRKGREFIVKQRKANEPDPALVKGWEELDQPTQKYVLEKSSSIFGTLDKDGQVKEADIIAYRLAKETGIDIVEAQELAQELINKKLTYNKFGEELVPQEQVEKMLTEDMNTGETGGVTSDMSGDSLGGEIPNQRPPTIKTQSWVKNNLFTKEKPPQTKELLTRSIEVEEKWQALIEDAKLNNRGNPAEEMVGWIGEEYKQQPRDAIRFWRQRGEIYLKSFPVEAYSLTDDGLHDLNKRGGTNILGNRKILLEDTKLIDDVYNEAYDIIFPSTDIGIEYVDGLMSTDGKRSVGGRVDRDTNKIFIDKKKIEEDFKGQVWTKPKIRGVAALPKEAIRTPEEWEQFVVEHEKAHLLLENTEITNRATRENHANKIAWAKVRESRTAKTEQAKAEQVEVVHSGAAKGADTVFQDAAEKRGISVKAHSFKGHEKSNKARVEHTPEELKEADPHLIKANKTLKRKFPTNNQFVNNLLRRNYYQVKDSDQIIAVSRIEDGQVKGGTAWATQMGIDMGKPVFVFDMNTNKWHKWDGSKYSVSEAPTLSKSFAGIGSRSITKKGEQAVEDLFTNVIIDNTKGRTLLVDRPRRAYAVVDDIVLRDRDGVLKEISLSQLETHFINKEEYGSWEQRVKAGQAAAKVFIGKTFKDMEDKGMHYYGGRGDAQRQYFVRYHPRVDDVNRQFAEIRKVMTKGDKALEKRFDALFNNEKQELAKYGMGEDYLKSAFVSNALYDITLQGFRVADSNGKTTFKHLSQVTGDGFINGGKGFNKRAQIWFTSGIHASPEYLQNAKIAGTENGKLKILLVKDEKEELWTDGSIYGQPDVIQGLNESWGMDPIGGVNKSFIVARSEEHGALLGKYMMHNASPVLDSIMKRRGIHLIVPVSSAKQIGLRIPGVTRRLKTPGGVRLPGKQFEYEIDIKDIKGILSETTDRRFLQNKKIPKQMFTNLTPYAYKTIDANIISDMYETLSLRSFNGTDEANARLDEYISNPKKNESLLPDILDNIEDIGISKLLFALKSKGLEKFSNEAYQRIQRLTDRDLEEQLATGEITRDEYLSAKLESGNQQMMHKRIIALVDDSLAGILHRSGRAYRLTTLRNYVVKQLTRPVVGNSLSARFRPYEWSLRERTNRYGNTSLLKSRDDVFFLDEGHKDKIIYSELWEGGRKLGQVWEEFVKSKPGTEIYKNLEEILTAATTRVPIDSLQGVRVLKFKGFTGIDGMGILVHPKVLEAEGGADLDGDKATIMFGDESHGFKKTWKKMYADQANEFENESMDSVKKSFAEEYTEPALLSNLDNKLMQYSPIQRKFFSDAAMTGREALGPAVVARAVTNAAYADLLSTKEKQHNYVYEVYNNRTQAIERYLVLQTPKDSNKARKKFTRLSRALIGYTSDPMDFTGLKSEKFKEGLLDILFDFKFAKLKKTEDGSIKIARYKLLSPMQMTKIGFSDGAVRRAKQSGLTSSYSEINSALYGRDRANQKAWSVGEIKEKLRRGAEASQSETAVTFLSKLARDMEGLDWRDSIFSRLNIEKIREMIKTHNRTISEHDWLKPIMERTSLRIPYAGKFLDWLQKTQYWDNGVAQKAAESKRWNLGGLKKDMAPENYERWSTLLRKAEERGPQAIIETRLRIMEEMVELGEDYLVADLSDLASHARVSEILAKMDESEIPVVKDIFSRVNQLKKSSTLLAKHRRDNETDFSALPEEDRVAVERALQEAGEGGTSRLLDQQTMDMQIRRYKSGLANKNQQDLFDAFMLGTYNRGSTVLEQALQKAQEGVLNHPTMPTHEKISLVKSLVKYRNGLKDNTTSISKLGFVSSAISNNSVKKFLDHYTGLYEKARDLPPKEVQRIKEEAKEADKPQPLTDPDGNIIKGTIIESEQQDIKSQMYIDDYAPFVGLREGKLSGDAKQIYFELSEHLRFYHNGIGTKLHEFVRTVVGKDLNNMHLEDFRVLNRYFQEMRQGTFFQRLMRPLKKHTGLDLSKWYYQMFPESINRDLLRQEIELVKTKQPYAARGGAMVSGVGAEPTSIMGKLVDTAHYAQDMATKRFEEEKKELRGQLDPYIRGIEDGAELHEMAIRTRELGIISLLKQKYGTQGIFRHYVKSYTDTHREAVKRTNWNKIKNKEYIVLTKEGSIKLSGEEITQRINDIYTKQNERVFGWLRGDEAKTVQYIGEDKTPKGLWRIRDTFFKDVRKAQEHGNPLELGLGIDGLRRVAKRIIMSYVGENKALIEDMNANIKIEGTETGQMKFEHYFPHLSFDKKQAGKALEQAIEIVAKDTSITSKERDAQLKQLAYHYKQLTGDYMVANEFSDVDTQLAKVMQDVVTSSAKAAKKIKWGKIDQRIGNQLSRSAHIPGWSVEPEAYEVYMKRALDNYYRLVGQITMRSNIQDFTRKHYTKFKEGDLTKRWGDFFRLYAQQALGFPSHIPEQVLNDPGMKIKGTPFAWFADSVVKARLSRMKKALGIGKDKKLPEELKGVSYQQMASWSNLEAKYELASLLAHPKSAIANLYGGTVHTMISTGYDNFKKARDFNFLARHVNPNWRNMQEVEEWVRSHAVIEEFMTYEANTNPFLRQKKWKEFMKEAVDRLKKEPDMEDKSLVGIAKKHGITEQLFNSAAWFMRRPERTLRRDAFVAHYLQVKEKFGGAFEDYNHPFLIKMAKKGVQGTQFLYSAPFRPMFSASSLGKVMTRFQLWAWNSVRFRNDVIRQAKIYGFKEGTESFDRLKRLAVADLMMLSLGSVFAYSLFENALPAPWNWFQDFADLMFGDDKDRERAFFGAYPAPLQPLQLVTPSFLRLLPATFKGIVTDDYSKLANYYIWTMFPFGRLGRDIFGKGGLLENPRRGVEKLTGLPYMQFASEYKKEQDKKKLYPRGIL